MTYLKALDDKKESLLAKQKEINLSSVEEKPDEPVDLVSDPHKEADKLEEMKVVSFHISFTILVLVTVIFNLS